MRELRIATFKLHKCIKEILEEKRQCEGIKEGGDRISNYEKKS